MIMECLKFTELKREDEDIGMKTGDNYCNEPTDEFDVESISAFVFQLLIKI
jgi:hypothetical protein